MTARSGNRGFTLVELSVVLLIIGIVTGVAITAGIGGIANARLVATQKKMKAIEDALMLYRTTNDRIPCPADITIVQGAANFGVEAANPGSCIGGAPAATFTSGTAVEGAVPAVTLGISPDFMVDGWGNRLRYAVDTAMTAKGVFSSTPLGANCGPITVNDAAGNARSTKAMYALVSHGVNGHGAYTPNGTMLNASSVNASELINCHCSSAGASTGYSPTYVQMNATQDPTNGLNSFDDIVVYKERWQFRVDWDKAGGQCTAIYVVDSGNGRVEKFDVHGNYLGQFGSAGSGDGQFSGPCFIAIDPNDGSVWVGETDSDRIQKFDSSGNFLLKASTSGKARGLRVDSSGNVWVADLYGAKLQKFDKYGTLLTSFGSAGSGDGQFSSPQIEGINIDGSGNIWVADQGNSRVQKFDSSGSYLSKITTAFPSSPNAQPLDVVSDSLGNVYVLDNWAETVDKFDNGGTYLGSIGSWGSGQGHFRTALAIAIDSTNNLYVTSYINHTVDVFDSSGSSILQFGSEGSGNGQFEAPIGIVVSGR